MKNSVASQLTVLLTILSPALVFSQDALNISSPVVLNNDATTDIGTDEAPRIATDGSGNWLAVWHSNENLGGTIGTDYDILVAHSSNNGATWSDPIPLNTNASTDTGDDKDPDIATDGAGNWLVVWDSKENLGGNIGTDYDIFAARSTDNGASWSNPVVVNSNASTDTGDDQYPRISTDSSGHWVVVWQSNDSLGGTIGSDNDILVSTSSNNGSSWSTVKALNTNASSDVGSDTYPCIANDGAGHWIVAWQSNENLNDQINTDGDILEATSTNNGSTWSAPQPLNANAATDVDPDERPDIATDGSGVWLAVWQGKQTGGAIGTDGDILLARSTDNGATWTQPGALNTNATIDSGADTLPRIATDTKGTWVTIWTSTDSLQGQIGNDPDILIASSTNDGTTWSAPQPGNTNAHTDTGADTNPDLAADASGNWVTVWDSTENLGGNIGTDKDILSAHFESPSDSSTGGGGATCGACGTGMTPLISLALFLSVLLPMRRRR